LQVDAIVCSTGEHLNLKKGVLSSAVLAAAGDNIQHELDEEKPGNAGDVLVTFSYRLPCRRVLHAVFPESVQADVSVGDTTVFKLLRKSYFVST
jgi:O-acetyl-ADP-ribose deacetylase (regulator of RNase III)